MAHEIMDLALEVNELGLIDLVYENGGLKLDDSFKTSLLVDTNVDSYVDKYPIGLRQGSILDDETATELWTKINHKRMTPDVINDIIVLISQDILQKYVDAGVWERHTVELYSQTNEEVVLLITVYSSYGNEQGRYFIPLSLTTEG